MSGGHRCDLRGQATRDCTRQYNEAILNLSILEPPSPGTINCCQYSVCFVTCGRMVDLGMTSFVVKQFVTVGVYAISQRGNLASIGFYVYSLRELSSFSVRVTCSRIVNLDVLFVIKQLVTVHVFAMGQTCNGINSGFFLLQELYNIFLVGRLLVA